MHTYEPPARSAQRCTNTRTAFFERTGRARPSSLWGQGLQSSKASAGGTGVIASVLAMTACRRVLAARPSLAVRVTADVRAWKNWSTLCYW
jgi:hypothetical protein